MPGLKKRKISHDKSVQQEHNVVDEVSSPERKASDKDAEETESQAAAQAPKTFKDLGLIPQLCEACETLGYKAPTAIQAEAIPLALQVCISIRIPNGLLILLLTGTTRTVI